MHLWRQWCVEHSSMLFSFLNVWFVNLDPAAPEHQCHPEGCDVHHCGLTAVSRSVCAVKSDAACCVVCFSYFEVSCSVVCWIFTV